ncbi:MAG TPA: efflux RND transporter periplasmic adaptor subunit [Vicinamibacteria bacterium]|nr:efflux RND transporter periplasmic adaptor subunit [Vicinamibacteria bacterium]
MRKGLIAAGVIVIAGGVTAVLYSKSNSSKANGFKTVTVARGSVVEKALAIGAIKPKREIAVKSKISGIVKTSFREIGDKVRTGDPLFEILPDPTPIELTEARREVEIAKNVFDQAQKKYDRSLTLKNQGILATQDWDQADKEIQDAKIRLDLSNERLALIEKGRVKTARMAVESIIRAPISGTVLELLVNQGDPVVPLTSYQAGTALTNLADMNTLVFKGTVDEIDVGKLHEGMSAHIKIGALPDAKVEGKIYKISPKSKTAEGATLFDVEVELLPAKDVVLRAGYSANAEIAVREKHDVLVIPERLVTFADGKASVELPAKAEKDPPVKKEIKTGLSDGMNVEVAEGLKEKDLVIERPPKKIE